MGVRFFDCHYCKESVCDCGPYFRCENCDHKLCDYCQANFKAVNVYDGDDVEIESNCPFCLGKIVADTTLFQFALKKLNQTHKELTEEYLSGYNAQRQTSGS